MRQACVLLAAVAAAWAQESAYQEIENKSRRESFQEALEMREVRESPAKDVGEALVKVEGVSKIRKAGIANDIVLRGFQQGNLNVLIDGVRIYGACPNHMDPAAFHVDFAEIQEVEVTKGVFDTRNEGSLGGAVNIIRKKPGQGLQVTPSVAAGSFGFVNPSAIFSYANDRFWATAGDSFRRSEPYRDGAGRRFTEYANYRDPAGAGEAFQIQTAWAEMSFAPRPNHRGRLAYTRQNGGQALYPYLMMDALYDDADRASASYEVGGSGGPLKSLRLEAYFTRVKHWMTDELRASAAGQARGFSMATFAATKTGGGRVEANGGGLIAGLEAYRRNWDAVNSMAMMGAYMDQHAIPNVWTDSVGAYAEYSRQFGRVRVAGGARLDRTRTAAHQVSTDLYWAYQGTRSLETGDTEPSANARVAWALPRGLELFAGAGRTSRPPDATECYFALRRGGSDWVGNPALRPVRNTEGDVGLTFRHQRLLIRPALFYSALEDFITLNNQARMNAVPGVMNGRARSYQNVDARIYGGELSWQAGLSSALLASGGVSYSRGVKDSKPQARIYDRDMAEMPPLNARLSLRYGKKLFFGEAEGMGAAAQNHVDSDLKEARTPGYAVLNLKGGVHTKRLYVAGGVENVMNRFYYEAFSYQRDPFRFGVKVPEPGRTVYVSVSYGF